VKKEEREEAAEFIKFYKTIFGNDSILVKEVEKILEQGVEESVATPVEPTKKKDTDDKTPVKKYKSADKEFVYEITVDVVAGAQKVYLAQDFTYDENTLVILPPSHMKDGAENREFYRIICPLINVTGVKVVKIFR
jgi:hypothetical protein